jgi:hypothetical protein
VLLQRVEGHPLAAVVRARHLAKVTDKKVVFHTTARMIEIATGTTLWTVFTLELMISDGSTVEKLNT